MLLASARGQLMLQYETTSSKQPYLTKQGNGFRQASATAFAMADVVDSNSNSQQLYNCYLKWSKFIAPKVSFYILLHIATICYLHFLKG